MFTLVDLVADFGKTVTVEEVNNAFYSASQNGPQKAFCAP